MFKLIFDTLICGGPVMAPIILLSLIIWVLIIEELMKLKEESIDINGFTNKLIELHNNGRKNEAIGLCKSIPGMAGKVLEKALIQEGKTREHILENVREAVLEEYPKLESRLPTIGAMASIAPLLGLLGTVTGMISVFTVITLHGTGDPQSLARGISEALITTQSGLIVAIPALYFHNHLVGKLNKITKNLEENTFRLINSRILKKKGV